MDTYGDKGNITAVKYRCKQRGINVNYSKLTIGEHLSKEYEFFFFGGGQDQAQEIVSKDLVKKSRALKKSINDGAVLLSICGGYQLLQKYFLASNGNKIPGIGLFNAYTVASTKRMMNNLLIAINPQLKIAIKSSYQSSNQSMSKAPGKTEGYQSNLIGFENHSGKTYLDKGAEPLGTVIKGNGNNGEDKTEGAIYKNAFGCYLHGSLLPKNPHFADYLITKALGRKYGRFKLAPLDDIVEWQAHAYATKITRSK